MGTRSRRWVQLGDLVVIRCSLYPGMTPDTTGSVGIVVDIDITPHPGYGETEVVRIMVGGATIPVWSHGLFKIVQGLPRCRVNGPDPVL